MKKVLFTILSFVALVSVQAQTTLEKGVIKMEISDVSSDNPEIAQGLAMLKGTQTLISFDGDQNVVSMNMMGGLMVMNTHSSQKDNKYDMLMDMMGQKIWVASSMDEFKKNNPKTDANSPKVTYDKNDTKKILGYNAYKAIVEMPGAEGMAMSGYVTDQIKSSAPVMQGMENLNLEGFPLEFTIKNPDMSLTITTKEIKDTVDTSAFELKTDGYQKMTLDEFTKQMGGMGGLGF